MKTTKAQKAAIADIHKIDDSLDLLRDNMLACSERNKPRYMKIVDRLLDERLLSMAERDKKPEKKKRVAKKPSAE